VFQEIVSVQVSCCHVDIPSADPLRTRFGDEMTDSAQVNPWELAAMED
jgi:hypothetical protein